MMMPLKENTEMDPLQFCYWLQGFAELNSGVVPNEIQWKSIQYHLNKVFEKKAMHSTPTYRDSTSLKPDNVWFRKPKEEEPDAYL